MQIAEYVHEYRLPARKTAPNGRANGTAPQPACAAALPHQYFFAFFSTTQLRATRYALPGHLPVRIFSGRQRGEFVAHADAQLQIIAWALRWAFGE